MATAKAKLHTVMARTGKKCRYETWQLPLPEAGSVVLEGQPESGLLDFNKQDPIFACKLHLPDGVTIQSSTFRRKKDAEQDAALLALQKMGVVYEPGAMQASAEESWEGLLHKVSLAFTDQLVLSYKPLAEHFRAAVQRKGPGLGLVPVIVLAVLDAKITSQCKVVDQLAETNPAYAAALVSKAASACPSLKVSDDGLWVGRCDPFSSELVAKFLTHRDGSGGMEGLEATAPSTMSACNGAAASFNAVYISACADEELSIITLPATPGVYYLDAIAHELGLQDAGHVFMSRQIAKTPDGSRLFWGVLDKLPRVNISGVEVAEQEKHPDLCSKEALRHPGSLTLRNERASFLVGHAVHGDAILATVGSTWSSDGRCIYDDFTLSCFHRLMLGRTPWGAYKLSRRSILVADLPKVYTCRAHWQGASPKSLLADFCQQHRLPEYTYNNSQDSGNNIANVDLLEEEGHTRESAFMNDNGCSKPLSPGTSRQGPFQCTLQVSSAGNEAREIFESDGFFRSRHDALQSAALKAVTSYGRWAGTGCLCSYIQNPDCCKANGDDMDNGTFNQSDESIGQSEFLGFQVIAEEDVLGDRPPAGSMVCVSYTVKLIEEGSCSNGSSSHGTASKELESHPDFKFELGVGAVISQFESCVSKASVGQTLQFYISAEALGVLFAACYDLDDSRSGLVLEYTVKLLKFEEALEDRIESSHFSPPLSKQRIEYARTMINALEAKTLVDLGCGSGSLLEALLKEPNTLEHMIGIDISRKALARGAKTLSAALTKPNAAHTIKSLALYEGSISDIDPHLSSPDLATCIEVVEHMDPEPLSMLGESILGQLVPKVWLVSTPNIEYNPIIRGLEWDPETNSVKRGASESVEAKKMVDGETPNLRNHDHRFEWTRAEFREWAAQLAAQYDYQVSFAGVGGDGEDDENSPGFATQIAVFAQNVIVFPEFCPSARVSSSSDVDESKSQVDVTPAKELWLWTSPASPPAAIL